MLVLLIANNQATAAQIHLDDEMAAIPAKITNIDSCGHWKKGGVEGIYRVIYVEFYYGNSLLYIQWLRDFTYDDPTRHVMHTLSIDEFNADDHIELTFDKPKCIETDRGIRFQITADSGNDESEQKYLFDLQVDNEFGKYSIRELTAE